MQILSIISLVSAESIENQAYTLVDMMNAFLFLISCIFIFAILATIRNKNLLELVRSAHFLKIKNIISAWTLLGSAVLLFAITEMFKAFGILTDEATYRLLKTFFGVLFAAGLFVQYRVLILYVKQTTEKKERKKSK